MKPAHALLQDALDRLKQRSPGVSIRALAARAGVSSSYLSKVLRGERPLPLKLLSKLAKALKLDHHEVAELQRLLLAEMEASKAGTGLRTRREEGIAQRYSALGEEHAWLLEKWFFVPLLNLATTRGFREELIAARLGITPAEAATALRRLVETGFLQRGPHGLVRGDLKARFPTARSHERLRLFQRGMIQKAAALLTNPPTDAEFSQRLLSSLCFAGDPARLPEAKLVIEEALYRAAEILAEGECTEVFQLNLQLFKLTK